MGQLPRIQDFSNRNAMKPPQKLLFPNIPNPNSFYHSMKLTLCLLQLFGYLPLKGINKTNHRDLRFTWRSWRVLYNFLSECGFILNFVMLCKNKRLSTMLEINAFIFQIECILLSMMFFRLAMKWPKFVKEWYIVEQSMKSYELAFNLKRKIIIIMIVIMFVALNFPYKIVENNNPSKLLFKDSANPNSFHDAMKLPLAMLQAFSYFPINGINRNDYRYLKFKWIHWKVGYNLLCQLGFILNFIWICQHNEFNNILQINAVCFQAECIVLSVLFLHLAMVWPRFVKEWTVVELSMKKYEPPTNLKRKIAIIITVLMCMAIFEHLMVTCDRLMFATTLARESGQGIFYEYLHNIMFPEVFKSVPYSTWLGIVLQIFVFQRTFMWTFLDVFIIVVSTCFHFRLKQISKKLHSLSRLQVLDQKVWRSVREDYVRLSKLCDVINKRLCWFIIISYLTNIYHILSQLFSSLKPMDDTFQKVYFYISFFLLILRVTLVCFFGGCIYDEHNEIVKVLTSVPSSVYNVEVERFISHLSTSEVVLTGKHFFNITRNLILKVASAVVTYELVLIQFNTQEFKRKDP
ncbi:hypothetical protein GWI33_014362 [Rhynchophorus ferrugineus]|uniref:Gustatory receptor n=1 Tax=Rhynchophorus ferrugineus TaxID=354439 RepID=A0A834I4N3_RHYFE|nr:hypothetical protein GWI33_014362 [Rhynchophorus ferrugineus]